MICEMPIMKLLKRKKRSFHDLFVGQRVSDNGFSLIEIVVTVAVLAILASISIPVFRCIVPKARTNAAYYSIKQILNECKINSTAGQDYIFTSVELDGYQVDSGASNNCQGDPVTGLVALVPENEDDYPRFNLDNSSGVITCSFKGESIQAPQVCLGRICGVSGESGSGDDSDSCDNDPNISKDGYIKDWGQFFKDYPGQSMYGGIWTSGGVRLDLNHKYCSCDRPCDEYGQYHTILPLGPDGLNEEIRSLCRLTGYGKPRFCQ